MRTRKYLFLAPALLFLLFAQASAQTLQFEFSFSPEQLAVESEAGYTRLMLQGGRLPSDAVPGEPWLPEVYVNIALPEGTEAVTCSADGEEEPVLSDVAVLPAQPPYPLSMPRPAFTPPNGAVYGSYAKVPASLAEPGSVQRMRGNTFVTVRLKPVRYVPAARQVYLVRRLVLTVQCSQQLRPLGAGGGAAAPAGFVPKKSALFDAAVRNIVVNPDAVEPSIEQPQARPLDGSAVGQPMSETVQYLIITTAALSNAFQALADHRHSHNGINTRVLCMEHIENNYDGTRPDGWTDIQTKIRNCIADYVANYGTEYVVLGGDDAHIAVRYCPVEAGEYSANMPTDLYYAGLDSTWDENTNGIYGEYVGVTEPEGDMTYDVIVSRIPVRTEDQAESYVNKLISFETTGDPNGFGRKVILGGYQCWDIYTGANRPTDLIGDGLSEFQQHEPVSDVEIWYRRQWRDFIAPYDPSVLIRGFYDTVTSWDGTNAAGYFFQNAGNMNLRLSEGWNLFAFGGHGGQTGWPLECGFYDSFDAQGLAGYTIFVYTPACNTAGFDSAEPCLSEAFLRNPIGGALVYIGCARFGWGGGDPYGGLSFDYQYMFFEQLYRYNRGYSGLAFLYHKIAFGASFRWLHYGLNLQGDPLVPFMRPPLPDTPTGVSASDGTFSDRIRVTWNAVTNATSYSVWRNTSTNVKTAVQLAYGLSSTTYDDTSAVRGTLYWYWVRSTNNTGPSAFSVPDSGYISLPGVTNVSASNGTYTDRIRVSWTPAQNATYYNVWRATNSSFAAATQIAQTSATSYDDMSAQPARLYYYWIQAGNPNFIADISPSAFGHRALPAPSGITASRGTYSDFVRVSWNASAGAAAYQLYRSTVNNSATATYLAEVASTEFEDFSATPGVEWFYWVKAAASLTVQIRMTSLFSSGASGWLKMNAPASLTASDGTFGDKVAVTWSPVAGAAWYDLQRSLTSNRAEAVTIATNLSGTAYDDTATIVGRLYYYWVRAGCSITASAWGGGDSGWRNTPSLLPAPTGVTATQGAYENKIRVTWNEVAGASTYEVWRSPASAPDQFALAAETLGPRYDDINVVTGLAYVYKVRAKNAAGAGAFSDTALGYTSWNPPEPEPGPAVFNDYNADGASDLAVYEPRSGAWYIRTLSGEVLLFGLCWGGANRIPAPGDYTGNGAYDVAVYDTRSGEWFAVDVAGTLLFMGERWGGPGMTPVSGDFSGNGRHEMTVFAAASGEWFSRSVFGTVVMWGLKFGAAGMVPVAGDYDGDGMADMALYHASSGAWYIMSSTGAVLAWAERWGGPGLLSVPGDYNGDSRADMAVYEQNTGLWHIRTLDNRVIASGLAWGGPGLVPVPGDYNGDGYFDLAVYNPADGGWYIADVAGTVIAWDVRWGGSGMTAVGQR